MKDQTRVEGNIFRYNGTHWVKEDSINMPVEEACTYLFFKYGAKGNIASKLLAQFSFEWEKANQEMDELIRRKKLKRQQQKN